MEKKSFSNFNSGEGFPQVLQVDFPFENFQFHMEELISLLRVSNFQLGYGKN